MAIEGYVGRPGSGKSYTLTAAAIEQADRGRTVYANYPINYKNCYTFGPDDLLDLPPGVVIIDEAHLWFPARQAMKLPPSWMQQMSQTRKSGWDLYWCTQHEARVDSVIRHITNWMWLCTAWFEHDGHPIMFKADAYEPEFFRNPKYKQQVKRRFFSKKVANAYDTMAQLSSARHLYADSDAYAATSVREKQRRAAALMQGVKK